MQMSQGGKVTHISFSPEIVVFLSCLSYKNNKLPKRIIDNLIEVNINFYFKCQQKWKMIINNIGYCDEMNCYPQEKITD